MKVQTRIITAVGAGTLMAGLAAGPALASTHTVQPGDTLSGIAASAGVSLTNVEAANRWIKNPNLIYVGQVVHVPDGRSGITPAAPTYYQAPATSTTPSAGSDTSAAASGTSSVSSGTSSESSGTSSASSGTGTSSASSSTPAASTSGGSAPSSFQQCVSWRESGNNPNASSAGLYGILPSTWASLGYSGTAQQASVAQQSQAFQQLYAQYGTSPWAPYDGC
ncbi:MAG: Transglycosylase-like domain [Streptosporangiaceae bacterium]|jgi:LysM repeat protein|nr:Transglycosylase-like domain [Streptosporangiaceae bacterium]